MHKNGSQQHALTPAAASIAGELGAQTELLRGLVAEERTNTLEVVVGNYDRRENVLDKSSVSGVKRVLVRRFGQGTDAFAVTTTPQLVLPASEGRLGGSIVNSGANAVQLYLCQLGDVSVGRGNRPAIWLVSAGGSWDFRLGNILWGGDVCAATAANTSTLFVAEF